VFGTLHTTTAASTVDRIIDQFSADRQAQIRTMLSSSLKGVIAQTLCKKIGGGRVAALEVMISNTAIASNIREGKTHQLTSVMQMGGKSGMRLLNDSLQELVRNRVVDPREAYTKCVDKDDLLRKFGEIGVSIDTSALGEPAEAPQAPGHPAPQAPVHQAPRAPLPTREPPRRQPAPGQGQGAAGIPGLSGLPGASGNGGAGGYRDPFDQFRQGLGK
jgi:hypothetical protein